MKVTINFSSEAYISQFVNNGNSIKSSVIAEFSAEDIAALTVEQRELLLKYTFPCKGKSSFDEERYMVNPYVYDKKLLKFWHYTNDVFAVIEACEELNAKSKNAIIQRLAKENISSLHLDGFDCSDERKVGYYRMILRYTANGESEFHGFDTYSCTRDCVIVYKKGVERQAMQEKLKTWVQTLNIVLGISMDVFVAQLLQLSERAYDEADAYKLDKQEKTERAEAEKKAQAERIEQRKQMREVWIAEHGSAYLKGLQQTGFSYRDVYDKEYAVFTYGENACLADEEHKYDRDYTDTTEIVIAPTEEHLKRFLEFKNAHPEAKCTLKYLCVEEEYYDNEKVAVKNIEYGEYSKIFVLVDDDNCDSYIYVKI